MISTIRLRGGGPLDGVGLAVKGKGMWLRGPGARSPKRAGPKDLFAPLPLLGVPLALFAVPELSLRYDARIEGEFNGTAVVLLSPRYTDGAGMGKLKLGVSKRHLVPTVAEVAGADGRATHRLLWLETRVEAGVVIADRLRLRTLSRKKPIDFVLVKLERGAALGRAPSGPAALR